jgi:N-acetylmuramoyl-L-alanine amidase
MACGGVLSKLAEQKTYGSIFLGMIFSLILLFPSLSPASATVEVTDLRYWSYPDYTRVVITLSDKAEFTKNRLSNPDRLYLDIKNSRMKREVKTALPVGNGMLRSVRAGQFNDSTVRVVLDLEKVKDYKIMNMEEPVRIMIDIYGNGAGAPVAPHQSEALRKRIVIDPGHGGHDTGAIGPNGLYEKDVVLDIALKLKKVLSENPDYEVFLTRDADVFIPLEERTAIANSKHADLFVSIHANASPRREARGIETYFLNWTNDEETMKVAARENQISMKKMRSLKKDKDVLDVMLGDLARDNKRDESMALANYIQKTLVTGVRSDNPRLVNHGVKWALFYVLFGARMPSVLVETSFISNPLEEKLLSKETYRKDLAKSIAAGIAKFMKSAPGEQTVARNRDAVEAGN